jgi:protocatechuate 3,4-dioxygenase beta subunit
MLPRMEDHQPITRRRAFGLAGAAGATYLFARMPSALDAEADAAAPSCILTPAKTEGPYFVDERLKRSDIRVDPVDGTVQNGVKVALTFVVVSSDDECAPVSGAQVDVWHANASGLYSDESANGTAGHKYLRGYQVTDDDGTARFVTVFPGWYSGRAIHVHFKIRKDGYEFTSQLFFDESTIASVLSTSAYSSRGTPDTDNSEDNIYGSDGSELTVALASDGNGGLEGTFTVGLAGVPGGDEHVGLRLRKVRVRHTESGRRVLRATVHADERTSVTARVSRSGHRLARVRVPTVKRGTHTLTVPIPNHVHAGVARLTLLAHDAAGNTKKIRRSVHIPR